MSELGHFMAATDEKNWLMAFFQGHFWLHRSDYIRSGLHFVRVSVNNFISKYVNHSTHLQTSNTNTSYHITRRKIIALEKPYLTEWLEYWVTQPFIATWSKVNGERPHCLHTSMTLQLGPLRSFSTAICSTFLLGKWPSLKDKGYCNNKKREKERLDFFFSTTEKNDLWAFFPLLRATLLLSPQKNWVTKSMLHSLSSVI